MCGSCSKGYILEKLPEVHGYPFALKIEYDTLLKIYNIFEKLKTWLGA